MAFSFESRGQGSAVSSLFSVLSDRWIPRRKIHCAVMRELSQLHVLLRMKSSSPAIGQAGRWHDEISGVPLLDSALIVLYLSIHQDPSGTASILIRRKAASGGPCRASAFAAIKMNHSIQ